MQHSKTSSDAPLLTVQALCDSHGSSLRVDRELRRPAQHEAFLAFLDLLRDYEHFLV